MQLTFIAQDRHAVDDGGHYIEFFRVTGDFPYPQEGKRVTIDLDRDDVQVQDDRGVWDGTRELEVVCIEGTEVCCHLSY